MNNKVYISRKERREMWTVSEYVKRYTINKTLDEIFGTFNVDGWLRSLMSLRIMFNEIDKFNKTLDEILNRMSVLEI